MLVRVTKIIPKEPQNVRSLMSVRSYSSADNFKETQHSEFNNINKYDSKKLRMKLNEVALLFIELKNETVVFRIKIKNSRWLSNSDRGI